MFPSEPSRHVNGAPRSGQHGLYISARSHRSASRVLLSMGRGVGPPFTRRRRARSSCHCRPPPTVGGRRNSLAVKSSRGNRPSSLVQMLICGSSFGRCGSVPSCTSATRRDAELNLNRARVVQRMMEEMVELRSAFRKVGHCFSDENRLALSPPRTIGARSFSVRLGSDEPMGGFLRVGDT